jgi:hypothetical protein
MGYRLSCRKTKSVQAITEKPLKAGSGETYGYGIYRTPNPNLSEGHARQVEIEVGGPVVKIRFALMCRVNVSSVHHCTTSRCPEAKKPADTLSITIHRDFWFVNCQSERYQDTRPCALLVKEER